MIPSATEARASRRGRKPAPPVPEGVARITSNSRDRGLGFYAAVRVADLPPVFFQSDLPGAALDAAVRHVRDRGLRPVTL